MSFKTKVIISCLVLLVPGFFARAQQPEHPWGIALRGGVIGNVHENFKSYLNHRRGLDLVKVGFSVDGMYDFTNLFDMRFIVSLGIAYHF